MAYFCKISCFQVIAFKIYGHFGMERCTKNKILLVKILKNRIRHKIKRFALFLFKFEHNTHFDSRNMSTFHGRRQLQSVSMALLGWSVARRIKFFLSKSLKTEYAIKSRDLLCFYSNFNATLILIVEICFKSQILKIFKFGPPTKKNFKFSPISPIFGQKFPNRDLLIYFHT